MIKYEKNEGFCILFYTAAATYILVYSALPQCKWRFQKDGSLILVFATAELRDRVYDMINERLC